MEGYKVTVESTSKELTALERIRLKDTSNAVKLDEALNAGEIHIVPEVYAVLNIHNEKNDNPDYKNYVIVDKDGTKFVTGSPSFWSSFMDSMEELEGEDVEFSIRIYKVDSKNYKGKQFITCSVE